MFMYYSCEEQAKCVLSINKVDVCAISTKNINSNYGGEGILYQTAGILLGN